MPTCSIDPKHLAECASSLMKIAYSSPENIKAAGLSVDDHRNLIAILRMLQAILETEVD
jgi:hypothetical protein